MAEQNIPTDVWSSYSRWLAEDCLPPYYPGESCVLTELSIPADVWSSCFLGLAEDCLPNFSGKIKYPAEKIISTDE